MAHGLLTYEILYLGIALLVVGLCLKFIQSQIKMIRFSTEVQMLGAMIVGLFWLPLIAVLLCFWLLVIFGIAPRDRKL
jgi:hypothetical protein